MQKVHRIKISAHPINGSKVQRFSVVDMDTGATLIERAKDPEWQAARLLVDQGRAGILETYVGNRSHPSFRVSLAKAAKLSTVEGLRAGPRLGKYAPHPGFGTEGAIAVHASERTAAFEVFEGECTAEA